MPGVKLFRPRCNQAHRDVLSGLSLWCRGTLWFDVVPRVLSSLRSPQNLKVEVLDFHAQVEWESGPGNPSNTSYVLELQEFGEQQWTKIEKCTSMLICDLDDFDDLMKSYLIRVKAEWGQESSEYANISSFQPDADTRFSPPSLNVMVQEGSIFADIHHPVTKKMKGLKFNIYLYRNASGQQTKVTEKISAEGAHSFHNLPPDRYCLRVSVHNYRNSLQQEFAEECIIFHPDEWPSVSVALGVSPLLLVLPAGLIVMLVLCYLWSKYPKTPQALKVRHRESKLLQVIPDKTRAVAISHQTWDDGETVVYVLKHEEDNCSASKTGSTYIRGRRSLYCEEEDDEEEDNDDDEDDEGDKCPRDSAGYGLEPDSSEEGALEGSTPSRAAACVNETEELEGNEHPSPYMERRMVGAQWQVHVPLGSVNIQAARSAESLEFIEETAESPPNISSESLVSIEETSEIPPNSSSGYEPRQTLPNSSSGYEPWQTLPNSSSGYETRPLICDNSEENQ
ncbi:cytokine receptor family member B12 isoform X2 [Sardina pilchardus]|uniref:cytokine receptor family member B12 isoform X2 n=1 Tax=Sardina pilchardus TaxID=27697 RepID=UPI002E1421E4